MYIYYMVHEKPEITHVEKSLNVWAIVLIIWSIYRAKFGTTLPLWFDEFIAKPIVFIVPVYWFIKKVEKESFFKSLGFTKKNILKELLIGFLIGLILFSILFYGFSSKNGLTNLTINIILLSLATSLSEEILTRGFILKRLYEASKNIYSASFFTSILYFFLHIPILFTSESISGFLLLRLMTIDIFLSFAISIIFLLRKNIIVPIFIHAFYALSLWLLI